MGSGSWGKHSKVLETVKNRSQIPGQVSPRQLYLSEIQLEHVADVVWRALGQLHQLLSVLESLAQLLHAGLDPVDSVDALRGDDASPKALLCFRAPCPTTIPPSHLHLECPSLYLSDALGDDEGDAIAGTVGHLGEVPAEQLEAPLQLLVAALDGQRLQATLVTGQEALRGRKSGRSPDRRNAGAGGGDEGPTSSHSAPWK